METDYLFDFEAIPKDREHRLHLMVRVKALALHTDGSPALNLAVVLDRSGSMLGSKLTNAKKAVRLLLKNLRARDRLGLITFNQEVRLNIASDSVTQPHRDAVRRTLTAIDADGATNLSGGWLLGCRSVSEDCQSNLIKRLRRWKKRCQNNNEASQAEVKRVLLLTDGLANRGLTDPDRLAAIVRQKRDEGISTTTVGVGLDFDEDLLTRMAVEGGGNFYFVDEVDNPDQISSIFAEELKGLLHVVGQNLVFTLTLSPTVSKVKQLNHYPAENNQGNFVFQLGDLQTNETKSLVVEMRLPAMKKLGQIEVGRLRLEYDELGQDQVTQRTLEWPLAVEVVPGEVIEDQAPNAEVLKTVLLLRAAAARGESIYHADRGDFVQAMKRLLRIADEIEAADLDNDELQAEHDRLREEAIDMELGQKRYNAYARKTTLTTGVLGDNMRWRGAMSDLHSRLKRSRQAIERNGETPTFMTYGRQRLDLTMDLLRIGRASQNYIVIPETTVSNYHCQIIRQGGELILVDLKSTNGTFANGGRVEGQFRLSVGDVVTIGSWTFIFQ